MSPPKVDWGPSSMNPIENTAKPCDSKDDGDEIVSIKHKRLRNTDLHTCWCRRWGCSRCRTHHTWQIPGLSALISCTECSRSSTLSTTAAEILYSTSISVYCIELLTSAASFEIFTLILHTMVDYDSLWNSDPRVWQTDRRTDRRNLYVGIKKIICSVNCFKCKRSAVNASSSEWSTLSSDPRLGFYSTSLVAPHPDLTHSFFMGGHCTSHSMPSPAAHVD